MSNLSVYAGGGTLNRVTGVAGAVAPYVVAGLKNILKGGAQERAITRGVAAAADGIASTVSKEVVGKISDQFINNPSVIKELSKQLGPIVGKMAVDKALDFLHKKYKQHYYTIWTIISICALITIRVTDLIFTRGVVTNTGARITARGLSVAGRASLKSARAVARAIKSMASPRSDHTKTKMLILFIILFGLVTSVSRPLTGMFIVTSTTYLSNRRAGGNNAKNVRNAVNSPRRSPTFGGNVPASLTRGGAFGLAGVANRPRTGVTSSFNSSRAFGALRQRPSTVRKIATSTRANNERRMALRVGRFA